MKATIGYLERNPEEGCDAKFRKHLDRWDNEDDWIRIVYFEVEWR